MKTKFNINQQSELNKRGVSVFYLPQFIVFLFLILVVIVLLSIFFIVYQTPAGSPYLEVQSTTRPDVQFYSTQILNMAVDLQNYDVDRPYEDMLSNYDLRSSTYKDALRKFYFNNDKRTILFYITDKYAYTYSLFNDMSLRNSEYVYPKDNQNIRKVYEFNGCQKKSIIIDNLDAPLDYYLCMFKFLRDESR